ncbi:hypothetical protein M569_08251 [Genlisea aurea]|uniref:Uncharacterized protein n=1 Tax=Genlisea aurea TaxID=192259 RepID=S8DTP4_9LAMI|nr:hypothetical protein M569_08251 [Genlisea aurea]
MGLGRKKLASLLRCFCSKSTAEPSDSSDGVEREKVLENRRVASILKQERLSRSGSRSMRFIAGLSFRREGKRTEPEDFLWKKPILLGEKCRIADEEEDDDAILYDENGNRMYAYRRSFFSSSPQRRSSAGAN